MAETSRDALLALAEMKQANERYEQAQTPSVVHIELVALGLAARRYLQSLASSAATPAAEPPQEPAWANTTALGICNRGHDTRQPRCPACHDMRYVAWVADTQRRAPVAAPDREALPPKCPMCGWENEV